jgi:hypothetical protein
LALFVIATKATPGVLRASRKGQSTSKYRQISGAADCNSVLTQCHDAVQRDFRFAAVGCTAHCHNLGQFAKKIGHREERRDMAISTRLASSKNAALLSSVARENYERQRRTYTRSVAVNFLIKSDKVVCDRSVNSPASK